MADASDNEATPRLRATPREVRMAATPPGEAPEGEEEAAAPLKVINRRAPALLHVISRLRDLGKKEEKDEGLRVVHNVDGVDEAGFEYDVPEDSYGAAILAIVKEAHEVYDGTGGGLSLVRCSFALGLLCVNLFLQATILVFIGTHVVQPAVHNIQAKYRRYHAEVFDKDGIFRVDLWNDYDGKDGLCQIGMTSRFFYCVLLFVWVTSMLGEFRSGTHLVGQVLYMPSCNSGVEMLRVDGSSTISIVALTLRTRLALGLCVCLPKMAISLFLLLLGCKWLSATTSFEALVMNTMAMEFVLDVDEMLYQAFLPVRYRMQVAESNFFLQESDTNVRRAELKEWYSYFKSGSYLMMGMGLVYLWSSYLQNVLPCDISDVKRHCEVYLKELEPICHGDVWSMGTGTGHKCYPFGSREHRHNNHGTVHGLAIR